MDNPVRTSLHFARIEQRRQALRETFATLFATRTEFVWEIGCGHGHFLTAYAGVYPDRLCIGIDIEEDRIARAERKCRRAGLPGLHFIHADARDFMAALPDAARFSAIYFLFPDPWPKKRHHKHRLMQPPLIAEIAARALPGARLYFRTDYQPYFDQVRAAFTVSPAWALSDEPWQFEVTTVFQARAPRFFSLVAAHQKL
jgi:tRNA (guanine-N7-)-methyltransferase